MNGIVTDDNLVARIKDLEQQLRVAKSQLPHHNDKPQSNHSAPGTLENKDDCQAGHKTLPTNGLYGSFTLHNLILLSDSALPLGSFAYSNGLESFLAHHKPLPPGQTQLSLFNKFLRLSVQSVTHSTLPYVLDGYRNPRGLLELDNDLDASTPCKVARAASVNQGRALLSIWEKSFVQSVGNHFPGHEIVQNELSIFAQQLTTSERQSNAFPVNGHLAPLWGVFSLALNQDIHSMAYLFILNHAKAVASAAVRANVLGPYSAQAVLAGRELQTLIQKSMKRVWHLRPEDAGQVVPVMDLWIGRHELLYSRIFNS